MTLRWPRLFPSLRVLGEVRLSTELVATATLFAIAVPEQLATSRLAQMPAFTSMWAFCVASIAFAAIGSNPVLSVGADSTTAPLFAAAITSIAAAGSPEYLGLVALCAVEVGVLVAAVGLARLGWIADFFSIPIVTGFMAGVGVIIIAHQIPDLFGVTAGTGTTWERITHFFSVLPTYNPWDLGIGLGVFAVATSLTVLNEKLPGALIGLSGATVLVWAFDLTSKGVAVLGNVVFGAPALRYDHLQLHDLVRVAPISAVIAVVVLSQTAATTRSTADAVGSSINADRDFVALGAGNLLAGLVGAFPVNASPPRSDVVAKAGGRTQLVGLVAGLGVVLLGPFAQVLHDVPTAALAGVLLFVALRLFHVHEMRRIFGFSKFEFSLATITALVVAFVGVEQGIGVALALAILDRVRTSARPHAYVLGRMEDTTSWEPVSVGAAAPVPGCLVFLFSGPVFYANADVFRGELTRRLAGYPDTRHVVFDFVAVSDIDFTGTRMFRRLLDELDRRGIDTAIARAHTELTEVLFASGIMDRVGRDRLFASVDAAVNFVSERGVG